MQFDSLLVPASAVVEATPEAAAQHVGLKLDIAFRETAEARADQRLAGCGLYGLFFRGRLAYVGKFRGADGNPWGSNVARERWWKHIATVTMRGSAVGSKPGALAFALRNRPSCQMLRALSGCPTYLRPTGCEASKNRLRFASHYWDEQFSKATVADVLGDFQFLYVRVLPGDVLGSMENIRQGIGDAEEDAYRRLMPVVNDRMPWRSHGKRQGTRTVERVLRWALLRHEETLNRVDAAATAAHQVAGRAVHLAAAARVSPRVRPAVPEQVRVLAALVGALGERVDRYEVKGHRMGVITIGPAGGTAFVHITVSSRSLTHRVKPIGAPGALSQLPATDFEFEAIPQLIAGWCP
jgi:hypothetical protein